LLFINSQRTLLIALRFSTNSQNISTRSFRAIL